LRRFLWSRARHEVLRLPWIVVNVRILLAAPPALRALTGKVGVVESCLNAGVKPVLAMLRFFEEPLQFGEFR
jgi:hypothetical protein